MHDLHATNSLSLNNDDDVQSRVDAPASNTADDVHDAELLLDLTEAALRDGQRYDFMLRALSATMRMTRRFVSPETWANYCAHVQAHPVTQLLREDPFIARTIDKPRGYAGDAVMIDMIYGLGEGAAAIAAATPEGQAINAVMNRATVAEAVRERRVLLASLIDAVAANSASATIFSVAAGHLREAEMSAAFAERRIGRWVALDQDLTSCAEVERRLEGQIETVPLSIGAILNGGFRLDGADFIYSAGLYDYLPSSVAMKLTRRLAAMLRPGGRLLFANFAVGCWDTGFMEAVMDWHLIYRTPADMRAIAAAAGPGFTHRHWTGVDGTVHYCELARP